MYISCAIQFHFMAIKTSMFMLNAMIQVLQDNIALNSKGVCIHTASSKVYLDGVCSQMPR